MSYAFEKFQGAVLELASPEPQRDRLINAYRHHLGHLDKADLPELLWIELERFRKKITDEEAVGEAGRVVVTVATLTELEVKGLIEEIFRMYVSLIKHETSPAHRVKP